MLAIRTLIRPDSGKPFAPYGVVNSPCIQAISRQGRRVLFTLASLFFAWMVYVVYTDIVGNPSPTLALTNGINLGAASLWSAKALCAG